MSRAGRALAAEMAAAWQRTAGVSKGAWPVPLAELFAAPAEAIVSRDKAAARIAGKRFGKALKPLRKQVRFAERAIAAFAASEQPRGTGGFYAGNMHPDAFETKLVPRTAPGRVNGTDLGRENGQGKAHPWLPEAS